MAHGKPAAPDAARRHMLTACGAMTIWMGAPAWASGGGGRDPGETPGTVPVDTTPAKGKKLNVSYTQKNLAKVKDKDLKIAIKANQTGHSVIVEGFNKKFSTMIFQLLTFRDHFGYLGVNVTARDRALSILSEISKKNMRRARRDALAIAIRDETRTLKEAQETLDGRIKAGLAQPGDYAAVNQQTALVDFLKAWRRNPAQGVVH